MGIIEKFMPRLALKQELARQQLNTIKNYSNGAASKQQNWARGLISSPNKPSDDIEGNFETLLSRGRHVDMTSALGRGAINKMLMNIVGSGLVLNPKLNAKKLSHLTPEEIAERERTIRSEWDLWAKSTECDLYGRLTFGQMQNLTARSGLVNGDVFAMLTESNDSIEQPYSLRVGLIEADRIRTPNDKINDDSVIAGIQLDENGRSTGAYVANTYIYDYKQTEFVYIPFRSMGYRTLLQYCQAWERVGQVRGVTVFAPIMEVLVQLDRYTKAELMANVVSSMLTVFVRSENGPGSMADGVPLNEQVDPGNDETIELGNGAVVGLAPGDDISVVNPARTNSSFDSVMTAFLRQLAMGLGMAYEVLLGHFQSSYSASRGALQETWKMYNMRREWLVECFCQPIYEAWLSEAVASGRIKAEGFFNDPAIKAAWCGSKWIGPAQTSLNPSSEASANKMNVEMGFTTHEMVIQQNNGMTFDQVTDTLIREQAARRAGGLIAEVVKNEDD